MTRPYRILISAELIQESALTFGGNRPHELVDTPLARDGRGRALLRGTSLAGSFLHTARRILGRELPPELCSPGSTQSLTPSRWRFEHSHLLDREQSQFFQHVSIDPKTAASADDHLFNLEAVERGTRWSFFMEIVPLANDAEGDVAQWEALAYAVLQEWTRPGGLQMGRGKGHGYGWAHLEDISIWRLDETHQKHWPNSNIYPLTFKNLQDHFTQHRINPTNLEIITKTHSQARDALNCRPEVIVELTGTLKVGERQDDFGQGYGLDSLSIGGHARLQNQAEEWFDKINKPKGIPFAREKFDPDFVITSTQGRDDRLEPYIPGASIRGVWRAAIARHLKAHPDLANTTLVEQMFGSTEKAGRLRMADAYLADENWLLAWQQHVAIDEFTGGAFESAKFDRLALLAGVFRWQAKIAASSEAEANTLADALQKLLGALGETHHLPLGGGQWRGHGHVQWQLESRKARQLGETT